MPDGPPDKPGVQIITLVSEQQLHDDLETALDSGYSILATVGQYVILARGYKAQ